MATKNTQPPAAPAPAPAEPAAPLPLPTSGGCWVRNADGTLSRDTTEHPQAATPAQQE